MRCRMACAAPTASSTVSPFMRNAAKSAPTCAGLAKPSMICPTTAAMSAADSPWPATTIPSASRIGSPLPAVMLAPSWR